VLGPDRTQELEAGGRRLLVHYGSGYRHAQVFAPPGGEFVCLEPMAAPTTALAPAHARWWSRAAPSPPASRVEEA